MSNILSIGEEKKKSRSKRDFFGITNKGVNNYANDESTNTKNRRPCML